MKINNTSVGRLWIAVLKKTLAVSFLVSYSIAPLKASASGYLEGLMKYIPGSSDFLILGDIGAADEGAYTDSVFTEDDIPETYTEFLNNTGINPEEDIHFIAGFGFIGGLNDMPVGGAVIRMDYEEEKLLESLRAEREKLGVPVNEKQLSRLTLYGFPVEREGGEVEIWIAFPDSEHLLIGNPEGLSLINSLIEEGEGQLTGESPIYGFAFPEEGYLLSAALILNDNLFSPDSAEFLTANPIIAALKGLEAIQFTLGFDERVLHLVLNGFRNNEVENAQLAGMLNGFKGMMMMASAENPEAAMYMDMVNIFYSPDSVTLRAVIPESMFAPGEEEEYTE